MKCSLCEDSGWVCESHPEKPWDGEHACRCGGAGMPCPNCNPADERTAPRPPKGFRVVLDKKGWRHEALIISDRPMIVGYLQVT
jgi:hypothetical protein